MSKRTSSIGMGVCLALALVYWAVIAARGVGAGLPYLVPTGVMLAWSVIGLWPQRRRSPRPRAHSDDAGSPDDSDDAE